MSFCLENVLQTGTFESKDHHYSKRVYYVTLIMAYMIHTFLALRQPLNGTNKNITSQSQFKIHRTSLYYRFLYI